MKKGGTTEINSFIAVNNASKSSPKKSISKPISSDERATRVKSNAIPKKVSPRSSSTNRASNDQSNVSATPKKVSTSPRSSSTARASNDQTNKTAQQTKPKVSLDTAKNTVQKPKPIQSTKIPEKSISSVKSTKSSKSESPKMPRQKSSLLEEKRGISMGKTTMEDVYKRRLRRKSEESELSSRRSSIASVVTSQQNKIKQGVNTIENEPKIRIVEMKFPENKDSEYEYEDDFEDYESDFESGSESNESETRDEEVGNDVENEKSPNEEEKKMDSGSYDLYRSQRQKNQLEVIKEALHKENTEVQRQNSAPNRNRDLKIENEPIESSDFLSDFNTNSLQNFSSAKKRQRNLEISNQIKKRGEKLLQMVTLDVMHYTLYEMSSVPYDVFMRCYARKDTCQAYVQTNEDNTSSEIQTEEIQYHSKWTQHPVEITKNMLTEETNLWQAMLGVGDENVKNIEQNIIDFNSRKLNEFMKTVGEEMIALLEEESGMSTSSTTYSNTIQTKISDPVTCIKCNTITFLQNRPIVLTTFDPNCSSRLLTVHGYSQQPDDNDRCSILCIWLIHQPLTPKMILKSYGAVTSCCFVANDSSFLVAGHNDGSLCVWDLRDNALYSEKLKFSNIEVHVRSPSYNTAEILKNVNHNSSVIGVDSIQSVAKDTDTINDFKTQTVYSIEEENFLIIWNLSRSLGKSKDIGLAPWSKIKFFLNQVVDVIRLLPKLSFKTTILKVPSENKILLGTNTGSIFKCSSYNKACKVYSKHEPEGIKDQSKVTCLEICPYDENYFAVGYSNGSIRLYNYNYSEPVSNLEQRDVSSASIRSLQWLWNKHNYILSLDLDSTLCIYQFSLKDYSLRYSIQIKEITSLVISSFNENMKDATPCLAFVSTNGNIEIHKLNATLKETNDDE